MPDKTETPGISESNKRYQRLEENIPGMVFLFAMHPDGSYSFPYVNSASQELFDISPSDLKHDSTLITDLLHQDDREKFERSVKHSAATLQPWSEELRYIVNGEVRWYDCISRPELQPNGDIIWSGIIFEITERKRAEEELQFFRFSIEHSKDAVFWLNHMGGFSYVNKEACRSLGYTREELLALRLWDIDPNFPEEEWEATWEEDARTGHRIVETEHHRKDGSIFPVEVLASHITFGTKDFHVAFVRDISDRKKAEEIQRVNEEKYRSVVDNIKMAIVLIDPDMKVLSVNKYTRDLFPDVDFEKQPTCYNAFNFPPREEPCSYCATVKTLEDGEVHETITETRFENGIKNFRIISSPIKDNEGNITAVIEIAEDITEKLLAEKEKKILEDQLIQAQKMEAIGTMAGGIAHDFNNILSIISGYTELALEEVREISKTKDKLSEVLKASLRARELVKQILSFSRKADQEAQPLSPHIIVKETLKLLRATIPATIEIQQHISVDCGTIIADPTQFHQIIMNLAMNAVHAMHEKGTLRVHLQKLFLTKQELLHRTDMATGPYIELSISDTGTGIAPEIIDRIFEPFFTTKEPGEGTGMGLSVVHGIVLAHHGMIKVDSEHNQGTTFKIYLPIAQSEEVHFAETAKPLPTGSERILFVDDEEELATLGETILKRLGYTVTSTTSSMEALTIFRSQPDGFDLVITDQSMPKMSGLELIEKLQTIRPTIPIILCTGYSSQITLDNTTKYGFKELIMKPVTNQQLALSVRKVLDDK